MLTVMDLLMGISPCAENLIVGIDGVLMGFTFISWSVKKLKNAFCLAQQ